MTNWPLPNIDGGKIRLNRDWSERHWFHGKEDKIFRNDRPPFFDLPKGWGNPWPDLPNPDEAPREFRLENIFLNIPRNFCSRESLLGYYMSWHIVGMSFLNERGRLPTNGAELKNYNDILPIENRFGIHICVRTIERYIDRFSTKDLDADQIPSYLEYCTFLTMIYVIAHEWGHYRSEVLSFQITKLVNSVTGISNSTLSPSFLSYVVHKKEYPNSNFEEVFAEWASLKLGIFNYYMKKPAFADSIPNWPLVEATVKFMLTEAISRPSRIRPYSDIRFWIDFDSITRDKVMRRLSENKSSVNRSVNDNVLIEGVKSFKKGKIIDLLIHNQMQFSQDHLFNGIVQSAPRAYPYKPDSAFYHFGDDECLLAQKPSITENYLQLGNPDFTDPTERAASKILKAIKTLKDDNSINAYLPIKVFTDLLPLDPVYFHV